MADTERTRALTLQLWAARDAGDVEAIGALLAPDAVLAVPASLDIDPVSGRERLAAVLSGAVAQTYLQADTIRREQQVVVADGDVSVVKALLSGRLHDGTPYDNEYVSVLFWRDGVVTRIEEHPDTLRIAQRGIRDASKRTDG